jgi:hypothetical protein
MWQCFRPTISHSKAGVGKAEISKNQEKSGHANVGRKNQESRIKRCLKCDFPCSLISTNQCILHFETCSSGGKRLFGYKCCHWETQWSIKSFQLLPDFAYVRFDMLSQRFSVHPISKDRNVRSNVDSYCQVLKQRRRRLFWLVNPWFPEICLNMLRVWFNLITMFATKDSNIGDQYALHWSSDESCTKPAGFSVMESWLKKNIKPRYTHTNNFSCPREPALPAASPFSPQLRCF